MRNKYSFLLIAFSVTSGSSKSPPLRNAGDLWYMSTDSKQGRITALYAWAALQQKEYNLAYEVITKKVSWHIFTKLFQLLLRTKGNDLLS